MKILKEALLNLGNLLHQMQEERGTAVLFLSSEASLFKKEVLEVTVRTQETLEHSRTAFSTWHGEINQALLSRIQTLLHTIDLLSSRQKDILNQSLSATEAINRYSHDIISPIILLMLETALADPDNDPAKVSSFSNFLQLKEKIGRERALGTRGLVSKTFGDMEFLERFRFLIAEQDSYKRTFLALADEKQKQLYQDIMHGDSIRQLDKIHENLDQLGDDKTEKFTPESWFDLISEKISLMKSVEDKLIDTLSHTRKAGDESRPADPEPLQPRQTSRVHQSMSAKQRDFILTLPFFSSLSEPVLADLLQHAQVMDYDKGKLLFLEGEQAGRLYIVLNGWLKLFKGNSTGEETVLQMLSSGDMVAASAVFLNAPYPVSAQVAKRAEVLSIPAPIIREKIRQNNELALSVLTGMSQHSQTLIQEFESIRLKPATERVGWFLLKLLLEQGRVPDLVELPYDKSLIASYLDMKPETFSRTLKKFKERGFEISKNSVILPDVRALCGFCDHDLALSCDLHRTPECPNPDCDRDGIVDF